MLLREESNNKKIKQTTHKLSPNNFVKLQVGGEVGGCCVFGFCSVLGFVCFFFLFFGFFFFFLQM